MDIGLILQAVMLVIASGFGGGDALDTITTDAYWRHKGVTVTVDQLKADAGEPPAVGDISGLIRDLSSPEFKVREAARSKIEALGPAVIDKIKVLLDAKDAELAETAKAILEKLAKRGQEQSVRRLMAIRTLGERKEASAKAVLEAAARSKELFVDEYAAAALARIDGKPAPARKVPDISGDVWLLPADLCLVGQVTAVEGITSVNLEKIIASAAPRRRFEEDKPDPKADEKRKEALAARANKALIESVEAVGNVRLTGMTLGVSADVGEREDGSERGYVITILHGKYNRDAAMAATRLMDEKMVDASAEYGFPAVEAEHGAFLFPSNTQAVMIAGPDAEQIKRGANAMKAALKAGKGTIGDSPLAKEVKAAQAKGGPAWAILKPNKTMKNEVPWLETFETIVLESKVEAGKTIAATVTSTGKDLEAVKDAVAVVKGSLRIAISELKQEAKREPLAKYALEVVESIKVETKAQAVTITGKASIDEIMLMFFGFLSGSGDMHEDDPDGGGVAVPMDGVPEPVEIER